MKSLIILLAMFLASDAIANYDRFKPGFGYYAALGQVDGVTVQRKFGHNEDIDSGTTPEDVWDYTGTYQFPASAQATIIVSDSTEDAVGGTGCSSVIVYGLDGDFAEIQEVVTLTGTDAVTLSNDYYRLHRVQCISSGSNQSNVGIIDTKQGDNIVARVEADHGITNQLIYTVPANKKWVIDTFSASIEKKSAGDCVVEAQIKPHDTNTWIMVIRFALTAQGSSFVSASPNGIRPFVVPSKSDVRVRVTYCSASNNQITANAAGLLIHDRASIY